MFFTIANLFIYIRRWWSSGFTGEQDPRALRMPKVGLDSMVVPLAGPPTKWVEAGEVTSLYVYPVKSMKGKSVDRALVDRFGLFSDPYRDRQFMVIAPSGGMVTGRMFPKLVTVEVELLQPESLGDRKDLILRAPGMEEVAIELPPSSGEEEALETDIFGSPCSGVDLGPKASAWLSQFLKGDASSGYRLIYHKDPVSSRKMPEELKYLAPNMLPIDVPFYSDVSGFTLLSQESIQDVNRHLQERQIHGLEMEEKRFRMNIYVAEDNWSHIRIGSAQFHNFMKVSRCSFTTIDPVTGLRDKRMEPVKTLRTYRKSLKSSENKILDNSPMLGIALGVDKMGEIKVGDKVFVGK